MICLLAFAISSVKAHSFKRIKSSLLLPSSVTTLRGGGSSPVELNPNYSPPPPPPSRGGDDTKKNSHLNPSITTTSTTLGDLEENGWIETTQQSYDMFGAPFYQPASIQDRMKSFVLKLHQTSPTLSLVSAVCVVIFCLWQVPACQSTLQKQFVCSRHNLKHHRYGSLVLSALSHGSLAHIVFNLFAYISLGPEISRTLRASNWPFWPFVLGAATTGSMMFLALGKKQGGCMGLSGVTLALLALYARWHPTRELRMALFGVIPIRLPAKAALTGMLVWSIVGSLAASRSRVAHAAHLGGLLFGMAYYELWLRRRQLRQWISPARNFIASFVEGLFASIV